MASFYRPFDVVFTRSQEYRQAVRALGVPDHRLETLRPGIRTDRFSPGRRDASTWKALTPDDASPTTVRFLSVGRVSVEKNLPFLVGVWRRASAVLEADGVAASLVVVGDGPYLESMRAELQGTRTRFLGFRHGEELSGIYASSDVFVFPSTTDTLGQVVLESQCSGVPVLVTDQGGPRSVVRDGVTGHVLSDADPSRWVEAIVSLARDHERRRRMGEAARAHASAMTIERSIDHFWAVHERASFNMAATLPDSPPGIAALRS
jgi:glycosyltransferase involved in cell wall biosynthesis